MSVPLNPISLFCPNTLIASNKPVKNLTCQLVHDPNLRINTSRPNSRNTSISGTPTGLKARQPSNSSIPVPTNNRTRTPSGSGPRGSLQRTGSNIGQRTTAYSADGSKFASSGALRDAVSSTRNSQM